MSEPGWTVVLAGSRTTSLGDASATAGIRSAACPNQISRPSSCNPSPAARQAARVTLSRPLPGSPSSQTKVPCPVSSSRAAVSSTSRSATTVSAWPMVSPRRVGAAVPVISWTCSARVCGDGSAPYSRARSRRVRSKISSAFSISPTPARARIKARDASSLGASDAARSAKARLSRIQQTAAAASAASSSARQRSRCSRSRASYIHSPGCSGRSRSPTHSASACFTAATVPWWSPTRAHVAASVSRPSNVCTSTQESTSTRPPMRRSTQSSPRALRSWLAAVRRLARPRDSATPGHSRSTIVRTGTASPLWSASSRSRSKVLDVRHSSSRTPLPSCRRTSNGPSIRISITIAFDPERPRRLPPLR